MMINSGRRMEYLPQLDGLRAIAILLVLWVHFPFVENSKLSHAVWSVGQMIRAGYIGVDLFFVLSGFLITRILLEERLRTGNVSFRRFYMKRALRIFPIYYLCIAVYALFFFKGDGDFFSLITYTVNYFKPFHSEPTALEQTWSLSVEEQFYLFWPFIVASLPLAMGRSVTACIIPMISLAVAFLLAISFPNALAANMIYMFAPTRMMSLSLGSFLAFNELNGDKFETSRAVLWAGAGGALLASDEIGRKLGLIPAGGFYWCIALVGFAITSLGAVSLLLYGRDRATRTVRGILSLAPIRYIGRISYGLYLYHYLVLFFLDIPQYKVAAIGTSWERALLAIILTFGIAHVSFRYLETPFLRLKNRLPRSRAIALTLT
jgi:peptidoglycan/LPS O-acetylase OafA/YrhL